jgi:nucleotide-binding universal stress UspA family protein
MAARHAGFAVITCPGAGFYRFVRCLSSEVQCALFEDQSPWGNDGFLSNVKLSKGARPVAEEPQMCDLGSAPAVVVGVDGSQSATRAALWAINEAASRDIPLRLVYVIDAAERASGGSDDIQLASARTALYDTQRTIQAAREPVKIETEILWGKPLAKLREESRSALMICIGSMGITHACRGEGSVARALPSLAHCPVLVVRAPVGRPASRDAGSVVVEVGNDAMLHHAFEEARLRGAPLRAVALWQAEAPDDIADGNRLAQAQLNRRITRWRRMYPEVAVESFAVPGSMRRYLAAHGESVQLLITGAGGHRHTLDTSERVECSVLTVRGNHL